MTFDGKDVARSVGNRAFGFLSDMTQLIELVTQGTEFESEQTAEHFWLLSSIGQVGQASSSMPQKFRSMI